MSSNLQIDKSEFPVDLLKFRKKIRLLDDLTINQIAAGEVIERPASVVKELVENSIDADATEITVVLSNGGAALIEVIDNGHGMLKEDAVKSLERFATSKINSSSDLENISSLGFRGEALPSIAAVSKLSLSTKANEESGALVRVIGGKIEEVVEADIQNGTRISVAQLFFNVPARKRFLKTEKTETANVRSTIQDFAVAYPTIRFKLVVDGAEVLNWAPQQSHLARVKELKLAGTKPLSVSLTKETSAGDYRISGVISQPIEAVASASRFRLIVNGRIVRDRLLLAAIRDGYGNYLRPGKYPTGVLIIELPPSEVDVNVHPQKAEVRFIRPQEIFGFIVVAIRKALEGASKDLVGVEPANFHSSKLEFTSFGGSKARSSFPHAQAGFSYSRNAQPITIAEESAQSLDASSRSVTNFRYLGQILKCYLLLEGSDCLAVVDMHAAHERITFYRLKKEFLAGKIGSQLLLVPDVIEVEANVIADFDNYQQVFSALGIECEVFGETSIVVRSLPSVLGISDAKALVRDLFSIPELSNAENFLKLRIDYALTRVACHGSIRSGRELEADEVYALLESLEQAENSGFCPHGRPVINFIGKAELELMFGRTDF